MNVSITRFKLALAASLMLGALPQAYAAGTTAGTSVNNTATVDFTVGGVAQTQQNSTTATFLVDRRINLTVAQVGGAATSVVPGATAQVTTFTVTNNSNSVEDFALAATQQAGGTAPFGGTDNFNATNVKVFVESGAHAGYQAAEDTAIFIDELAADANKTVYVVVDIPAGQSNGDIAGVTLTATAAQSTDVNGQYVATAGSLAANAVQTNTSSADVANFVDTVFGDVAGQTDAALDGKHSAGSQFNVVTATLTFTKSSTVVSDPFNGTTNPKAIPGAIVEYCLDVANTGAVAANAIVLTDVIPSNTTYSASTIKAASSGTGTACTLGSGTAVLDTGDANGDYNVTSAGAVTVKASSIGAGARFKAVFRVQVN
jgi:uncharacterized repeat protein (TIGR01451 family)